MALAGAIGTANRQPLDLAGQESARYRSVFRSKLVLVAALTAAFVSLELELEFLDER